MIYYNSMLRSACLLVLCMRAHGQCEDDATFSDAFNLPCGDWNAENRPGQTCVEAGAA